MEFALIENTTIFYLLTVLAFGEDMVQIFEVSISMLIKCSTNGFFGN